MSNQERQLAERIREACIREALAAYQDAGVSGLCAEGRWEYTIGVLRQLDLKPLLEDSGGAPTPGVESECRVYHE